MVRTRATREGSRRRRECFGRAVWQARSGLHPRLVRSARHTRAVREFIEGSRRSGRGDTMSEFRVEKDSMGEMKVPADAYYGAQTGRAVENFPISDLRFSRRFIAAMGLVKWACAQVNHSLGLLDDKRLGLVQQAAQEVIDGKLDAQF